MTLRPETLLRRKLELQIALQYETKLLELRTQVAQLQRELEERAAPPASGIITPVPECDCVWCRMARESAALCEAVPKRSAIGPQG